MTTRFGVFKLQYVYIIEAVFSKELESYVLELDRFEEIVLLESFSSSIIAKAFAFDNPGSEVGKITIEEPPEDLFYEDNSITFSFYEDMGGILGTCVSVGKTEITVNPFTEKYFQKLERVEVAEAMKEAENAFIKAKVPFTFIYLNTVTAKLPYIEKFTKTFPLFYITEVERGFTVFAIIYEECPECEQRIGDQGGFPLIPGDVCSSCHLKRTIEAFHKLHGKGQS